MTAHLTFNFLTRADIRASSTADKFFTSIARLLPAALPRRAGTTEPLAIDFSLHRAKVVEAWPLDLFWKGSGSYGRVFHHTNRHSSVMFRFAEKRGRGDGAVELLRECADLFEADLASVHPFQKQGGVRKAEEVFQQILPGNMRSPLPTLPWAGCLGPPYLALVERERLLGAPFAMVLESAGRVVFRITEDFNDVLVGAPYLERLEAIRDQLGESLFATAPSY